MNIRVLIALLIAVGGARFAVADEPADFFETHVRPLLAGRCLECHRREAEGGLRLDSLQGLLGGGNSGPAIVVGKPRKSLLWQVVSGKHAEISMPPDQPLNAEQVGILEQWIADGAHWPQQPDSRRSNPDEFGITAGERQFWSFQPVADTIIPRVKGVWSKHPVDALIAVAHQRHGLTANPTVGPGTLIRRVTYDLIGLPPSPREIADFEVAWRQEPDSAYQDLVQRLLDSPHYGERWAQHWLDLVRYADTAGDAADFPIPEAYKYRNYVIAAFNDDKPYDQFVREQIAGDLMQDDDPDVAWQRVIATGYIAISRRIGVSPHGQRHITIEDTLNNLGKTFLALSIGCARCHDHKFDPIPTSDYYALYGIFDSTVYPHAGAEHRPYRSDFVYRVGRGEADRLLTTYRQQLEPCRKQERAAFERYRDFQRMPINLPGYNRDVAWQEVLDLREEIRKVAETFPDLETALAVSEGEPKDAPVQLQGEPKQPGAIVPRGFLQVLGGQTLGDDVTQSGRLQLAEWITDESNPLTARVIANRLWHHHFGRGLVETTSDFGVRGSRPTHPALLDFLARYLIDNDWSLKQLHRLIVSSRTYQLSSAGCLPNAAIDPQNQYLWRANRRRLDAEQLRDSILVHSGQLDRSPGGAHPMPHRLTYYFRQHEPFVGHFPSLQSLFLMNSPFVDEQARRIAAAARQSGAGDDASLQWLYRHLFGRSPEADEIGKLRTEVETIAQHSGGDRSVAWSSLVKAMLCSNEFLFID
jgi:hypothetical protein